MGLRYSFSSTFRSVFNVAIFLSLVLGHVLATELQVKNSMDVILSLAAKKEMTNRETLHVEAVKQWSSG